jgi:hypothetical protein
MKCTNTRGGTTICSRRCWRISFCGVSSCAWGRKASALTDYCERIQQNLRRFDLAEKRVALEAPNITVTWMPDQPLAIQDSIPVPIASNSIG